jgi:hypothetical protein
MIIVHIIGIVSSVVVGHFAGKVLLKKTLSNRDFVIWITSTLIMFTYILRSYIF